jgi:hypothetical protein
MEDVLDVYTRPLDPRRPLVCLDEASTQLLADVTPPLPPASGRPAREDYEYKRCGTASLFLCYAPLLGQRHITASERRTKIDFAHVIKDLLEVRYPDAEQVLLVMDNLNTHTPASLYEAFPPAEAKRLADRLEIHYTPKHGSWLNMAEIELSVLACAWPAVAGPWRSASRRPSRRSAWPSTRSAAGPAGIGTSRSPAWRTPSSPSSAPTASTPPMRR